MTARETNEERPRLRSVKNTAKHLGLGLSTTWKLIKNGKLKVKRIGRRTLVTDNSTDSFLKNLP